MLLNEISSYWNVRADGYSDTIHMELNGKAAQEFQTRFTQALSGKQDIKCLDIGCGPGFFSILLAATGQNVTAVDYSTEMLEYARRNCQEKNVNVEFHRADAQNLPFADESFDFICSRNLVWNLEDPEKAYREWFRVLRPGGRMFIFDGNYYLHYYDKDYSKAREYTEASHGSEHPSLKGVDPTPIDEIARNLPLSRELRPDWDEKALKKIGFKILEEERFSQTYVDSESKEEKEVVHSFILLTEK